ncbi:hypothetical protein L2747_13310 [Shewanella marinintestina]|uniref:hypothetical protein n=1 Tax=Shewanella marinintestina TaxID=190305 RepID=UPI00200D11B6|nr:hypothetical protein [Shewanella marinintestina]MCL1146978.1 hypothetical protein [Shewanella marinintestina]
MFFSSESNIRAVNSFIQQASISMLEDDVYKIRLDRSLEIIKSINKNPEGWSERCRFNIHWIGDKFIDGLSSYRANSIEGIDSIYTNCYRFLCEFDFFIGAGKELSFELGALKSSIQNDALKLDSAISSQIVYASYVMPANLIKEFLNNQDIEVISTFNEKVEESKQLKSQWDLEIVEKESSVNDLKSKLDEYKIGFNFVGLYKGFNELADKKEIERKFLIKSLLGLGFLILLPLLIQFGVSLFRPSPPGTALFDLFSLMPLISIEIILVYFFRIVLHNYKSAKTQIVQIELRKTLCQFIQSYAQYASTIKKNDATALEKFENLIFSGIMPDSEKLPATFDGIDQLSSFFKNVKGS